MVYVSVSHLPKLLFQFYVGQVVAVKLRYQNNFNLYSFTAKAGFQTKMSRMS